MTGGGQDTVYYGISELAQPTRDETDNTPVRVLQDAPDLLASPFSGQNTGAPMAAVPEELSPHNLPLQALGGPDTSQERPHAHAQRPLTPPMPVHAPHEGGPIMNPQARALDVVAHAQAMQQGLHLGAARPVDGTGGRAEAAQQLLQSPGPGQDMNMNMNVHIPAHT